MYKPKDPIIGVIQSKTPRQIYEEYMSIEKEKRDNTLYRSSIMCKLDLEGWAGD